MRIIALNMNHRTHAKASPPGFTKAILSPGPDLLVLTEFVERPDDPAFLQALEVGGLPHFALSPRLPYSPGRWHNQGLIASRSPLQTLPAPPNPPDRAAATNILRVRVGGLRITGIRAPMYQKAAGWYRYWDWLSREVEADVLIGDLNADPRRPRKRDRVLRTLAVTRGYRLADPQGDWSYRGLKGSEAKLDHVLPRGVRLDHARYVPEPFVSHFTDHAALIADVCQGD